MSNKRWGLCTLRWDLLANTMVEALGGQLGWNCCSLSPLSSVQVGGEIYNRASSEWPVGWLDISANCTGSWLNSSQYGSQKLCKFAINHFLLELTRVDSVICKSAYDLYYLMWQWGNWGSDDVTCLSNSYFYHLPLAQVNTFSHKSPLWVRFIGKKQVISLFKCFCPQWLLSCGTISGNNMEFSLWPNSKGLWILKNTIHWM